MNVFYNIKFMLNFVSRGGLLLMFTCTVLLGGIDLATMALLAEIFKIFSANEKTIFQLNNSGFSFSVNILHLTVFLLVVRFFGTLYSTLVLNYLIFGVRTALSASLLNRFLTRVNAKSGPSHTEIWKKLIYNETNQVIAFIKPILTIIFDTILFLMIAYGVFRHANLPLLLVISLGVSISFLLTFLTLPQISSWGRHRQKYDGQRLETATKVIHFQEYIQSDRLTDYFNQKFKSVSDNCVKYVSRYTAAIESYPLLIEIIFLSLFILFAEINSTEAAVVVPLAYGGLKALPLLKRILTSVQRIKYGMVAVDLIKEEFEIAREPLFYNPKSLLRRCKSGFLAPPISLKHQNGSGQIYDYDQLELPKTGLVSVTGDNGVGKSSWLRSLAGFSPVIRGKVTDDDTIDSLYVPQRSLLVAEDLKSLSNAIKIDETHLHEMFQDLSINLDEENKFRQTDSIDNYIGGQFSGGQQQRLNIGLKLCSNFQNILLDEPTSEQDISGSPVLVDLLAQKSNSKLIICVTHDVDLLRASDFVYELVKKYDRLSFELKEI